MRNFPLLISTILQATLGAKEGDGHKEASCFSNSSHCCNRMSDTKSYRRRGLFWIMDQGIVYCGRKAWWPECLVTVAVGSEGIVALNWHLGSSRELGPELTLDCEPQSLLPRDSLS